MFIVRYGGNWDNPKIAFATEDEELAKKIVAQKKQEEFDKRQKFNRAWTTSRKARYNLSKLLASDPRTKESLGEEEYKYLLEEIETQTLSWEHSEKSLSETIEDMPYYDWFYEEVFVVSSLDVALEIIDKLKGVGVI